MNVYLALFDFVPNLAFLVGAVYLVRLVSLVRGQACGRLAFAGASLVLLGGFLQATWKLLFVTGTSDLRLMSHLQFILLAPGFVCLLIAVILLARRPAKTPTPPVLAILPWKLPFLVVMVLASLAAYSILASIAFRRRAYAAGVGFVIALVCVLAMGGMAGGEQTLAQQWTEELVNSAGQIAFAAGSFFLYRDFKARAG